MCERVRARSLTHSLVRKQEFEAATVLRQCVCVCMCAACELVLLSLRWEFYKQQNRTCVYVYVSKRTHARRQASWQAFCLQK